jgi:hypothetical protein
MDDNKINTFMPTFFQINIVYMANNCIKEDEDAECIDAFENNICHAKTTLAVGNNTGTIKMSVKKDRL